MRNLLEESKSDAMNMKELKVKVLDHISKFVNNQSSQQLAKFREQYIVPDAIDEKKDLSKPLSITKK